MVLSPPEVTAVRVRPASTKQLQYSLLFRHMSSTISDMRGNGGDYKQQGEGRHAWRHATAAYEQRLGAAVLQLYKDILLHCGSRGLAAASRSCRGHFQVP